MPKREDDELLAKLLFSGLADLTDTFLGDAEFARDVVERGVFHIVAVKDARVIRRQLIERGANGSMRVN